MYEQINERIVTDVIASYQSIKDRIYREILWSKEKISELSDGRAERDIIQAVSMPGEGFGALRDVTEVLRVSKGIHYGEVRDLLGRIAELTEREETCRRIMACYQALPTDEHLVLKRLYEETGVYKEKFARTARELDCSDSSIKRKRRDAIDHILKLYRLEISNQDIFRWDFETERLRTYR